MKTEYIFFLKMVCCGVLENKYLIMILTFLGTGTSTGVPQLRCDCKVCRSQDPRDRRMRASVLIEAAGKNILIDSGPDFYHQMLASGTDHIDAVLLTHSHYDHVGGIDDLRPYCYAVGGHLPVYCKKDVARDLRARVPYCFAEHPYPGVPTFTINEIDTAPFNVADGIEVIPLPVMHGRLEIRGFRIGDIAYITDCLTMPSGTLDLIKGVDTLVVNALRIKPHESHMNLAAALDVIKAVGPRRAFLTHLSHDMGLHADVDRSLPSGVSIAFDGLVVR